MVGLSDSNKTNIEDEALVNDVLGDSGLQAELTVGTSAVEVKVGSSRLANRKLVVIQPKDVGIFLGFSNTVTTANGIEVFKDTTQVIAASDESQIWLIASSAGKKARILESS